MHEMMFWFHLSAASGLGIVVVGVDVWIYFDVCSSVMDVSKGSDAQPMFFS